MRFLERNRGTDNVDVVALAEKVAERLIPAQLLGIQVVDAEGEGKEKEGEEGYGSGDRETLYLPKPQRMLLDALVKLKAVDPTLSFRRSCREGVCGSDSMNINGKNGLACLTNMRTLPEKIVLKPLPGLPVILSLIHISEPTRPY